MVQKVLITLNDEIPQMTSLSYCVKCHFLKFISISLFVKIIIHFNLIKK